MIAGHRSVLKGVVAKLQRPTSVFSSGSIGGPGSGRSRPSAVGSNSLKNSAFIRHIYGLIEALGSIRRGSLRQWTAIDRLLVFLSVGLALTLLRTPDQMAVGARISPFA
jgi:hypothetical protein